MLGWFKKKFGKKKQETVEEVAVEEVAITPEAVIEDAPPALTETAVAIEEEATEEKDEILAKTPTEVPSEPTEETIVQEPEELEPAPAPVQVDKVKEPQEPEIVETPESEVEVIETDVETTEPESVKKEDSTEAPVAEELSKALEETEADELPAASDISEAIEEPVVPVEASPVSEPAVIEEPVVTTEEAPQPAATEEKVEVAEPADEQGASDTPAPKETDSEEALPLADSETEEANTPQEPKVDEEEDAPAESQARAKEKTKPSFFSRLSAKLAKSKEAFTYQLDTLFLGKKTIDAELLDDLEEILITADLGYAITEDVLDHARRKVKRNELSDPAALKDVLKEKLASYIEDAQEDAELVMPDEGPFIIMVIGVNGVGKTTTIGKVAHKFVQSGQSVLLIAADTFRAAAVSQLQIWGERNGVDVFSQKEGADPSSVAFDGIAEAVKKDYDVVIIDTAGRLHTQANLMEELKKIKRVVGKKHEGAPHEVMLVIDATTGQNGISQAKLFNEAVNITGIALTKLDGTAKGGIVTNISKELQTPIRFIGVGEGIEDLRDFDHREFIDALFDKDK